MSMPLPTPASPDAPLPFHPHGRGTGENPRNRFETLAQVRDEDWDPREDPSPATQFLADDTQTIINRIDSPDLMGEASFNPYRGCEHGCIYCYARPYHEYLGMSAGLDFETKILVKQRAPELLRAELSSPAWKPTVLMVSGVTDCYQPVERRLRLTRRCLEVLAEFRNPAALITKNALVTRDIDVLRRMAGHHLVCVTLSITSLRAELARDLEPRTSAPAARLDAIRALAAAGIPVGVNVAPIIPGLNDEEVPDILRAAAEAGATHAGYTIVRLPHGVADLFTAWLDRFAPDAKNRILHRIESMRGGRLNDPRFGTRMTGEGIFAEQIGRLFAIARRKAGIPERFAELSTSEFRSPHGRQLGIFDLDGA
jgi:DNA repair photolyase